jgi:hypothetical protein
MKYPIYLFLLITFSDFGLSMKLQINNQSGTYMFKTIMGIRVSDKETHIDDIQKKELNDSFKKDKYPITDETKRLSTQTGLSEQIILIWFQHKRKDIKTYKPILSIDGFRVNPLYKKESFQ